MGSTCAHTRYPGLLALRAQAVATTRTQSAYAARDRFAARHAFTDAVSLVRHPDVDLVVVTVKVPAHAELVTAAVDAGKDVPHARVCARDQPVGGAAPDRPAEPA
jgi:predicted dehydrogenase